MTETGKDSRRLREVSFNTRPSDVFSCLLSILHTVAVRNALSLVHVCFTPPKVCKRCLMNTHEHVLLVSVLEPAQQAVFHMVSSETAGRSIGTYQKMWSRPPRTRAAGKGFMLSVLGTSL